MSLFKRRKPVTEEIETTPIEDDVVQTDTYEMSDEISDDVEYEMIDAESIAGTIGFEETPQQPALMHHNQPAIIQELNKFTSDFHAHNVDLNELDELISGMKMRGERLHAFSQGLQREAVRNIEVVRQRDQLVDENEKLKEKIEVQDRKISDLQASAESLTKLRNTLTDELAQVTRELEKVREERDALVSNEAEITAQNEKLEMDLDEASSRISHLETDIDRLRTARAAAERNLLTVEKELSETRGRNVELEMQNEEYTKVNRALISEREKGMEEKKSLRREMATGAAQLDDFRIKFERLKAENQELSGRLASERFAAKKDHEGLVGQIAVLREQYATLTSQLQEQRDEANAANRRYEDIRDKLHRHSRTLEEERRNLANANLSISEMNLKYSTDMMTLDQLREENADLRARVSQLQNEKVKLTDYENQARVAQVRADKLEAKLSEYVHGLKKNAGSNPGMPRDGHDDRPSPSVAKPSEDKPSDGIIDKMTKH